MPNHPNVQVQPISYVASGKTHFFINGKERIVTAGHMMLYLPCQKQDYVYYGKEKPEVYWTHFTGGDVKNILRHYDIPLDDPMFYYGVDSAYTTLFKEIINDFALSRSMSVSWFLRNFKQATGMSPMQYILMNRINNAVSLLETTDYNVNEISRIVGYENPLYFSRLLKSKKAYPRRNTGNSCTIILWRRPETNSTSRCSRSAGGFLQHYIFTFSKFYPSYPKQWHIAQYSHVLFCLLAFIAICKQLNVCYNDSKKLCSPLRQRGEHMPQQTNDKRKHMASGRPVVDTERRTHLGQVIRKYRIAAGMDQAALAAQLGYTKTAVGNWELGGS